MSRIGRTHTTLTARSLPRLALATLVAGALLVGASAAHACQKDLYDAAAKYAQCDLRAFGKLFVGGGGDIDKVEKLLSKCRVKYTQTWVKLQAKWSGTGSTCDAARFAVGGGTVTDNLTGLQWEQKTDDATIHDKDDVYSWSTGFGPANGTAYTVFLAALNGGCFAGQCDWRLPTRAELQTILLEPYPCATSPCIDQGTFGPTAASFYWSSTTNATGEGFAWGVQFANGAVGAGPKDPGVLRSRGAGWVVIDL